MCLRESLLGVASLSYMPQCIINGQARAFFSTGSGPDASPIVAAKQPAKGPDARRVCEDYTTAQLSWVSASHRGRLISSMNASNSRQSPILNYRVFFQWAQNNRAD
jgi:hypothetical protein